MWSAATSRRLRLASGALLAAATSCACGPSYGAVSLPTTLHLRSGGCAVLHGTSVRGTWMPMVSPGHLEVSRFSVTSSAPQVAHARVTVAEDEFRTVILAGAPGSASLDVSYETPDARRRTVRIAVTVDGSEATPLDPSCYATAAELPAR